MDKGNESCEDEKAASSNKCANESTKRRLKALAWRQQQNADAIDGEEKYDEMKNSREEEKKRKHFWDKCEEGSLRAPLRIGSRKQKDEISKQNIDTKKSAQQPRNERKGSTEEKPSGSNRRSTK
uniref:Uncharacterized protein n=1 Tax=Glossina brevipalpis TaxID=37001 RepID=A0A1A9WIL7_9MUSC